MQINSLERFIKQNCFKQVMTVLNGPFLEYRLVLLQQISGMGSGLDASFYQCLLSNKQKSTLTSLLLQILKVKCNDELWPSI